MATSVGFQLEGGRIPGERIATAISNSDSPTFTSETSIGSVTADLVGGRTYAIVWDAMIGIDSDGVVRIAIREDGDGGSLVQRRGFFVVSAANGIATPTYGQFIAPITGTKTFVITGEVRTGGGNAHREASSDDAYVYVEYISG